MKIICTWAILLTSIFVKSQTNPLILNPNIVLPKDSIEAKNLIISLNAFLLSARQPIEENNYVLESEKIETYILLDEMNGIEKNVKFNKDFFYKPYLTNVVLLNDNNYLIQLSYIGTYESEALLRASFELIAHKKNNSFVFSSPLLKNTLYWNSEQAGNNLFHFKKYINKKNIKELDKLSALFDKKLKSPIIKTEYYCCDNIIELQKLIGVDYKSDYNGRKEIICSSTYGNRKLIVLGNNNSSFNEFDPHDLFHDRLSTVISRSKVNKPVDEGCAYLYGGSWGLSWKEIFNSFKEQIASNKNTNWVEIKEKPVYFKTNGFKNSADYIINALLVEQIEKKYGFDGVWKLLNVGPFEQGNDLYYQTLERLTGISKTNYNEKIWELINNEK